MSDTSEGSQGSQSSGATPPPEDEGGLPDLDFPCDILERSAPPSDGGSGPEGEELPEEEDEEEPEEEEPAFDLISDGPKSPPPGGAGGLAAASSAVGNAPNLLDKPWAIQGWGGPEDPDVNSASGRILPEYSARHARLRTLRERGERQVRLLSGR